MRASIALGLLAVTSLFACGGSTPNHVGGGGAGSTTSTTSTSPSDGCERGLVRCGDACLDLENDDAHCGACSNACAAGEVCIHRSCIDGFGYCGDAGGVGLLCGAQCVLPRESVDHCGTCGNACGAESYCSETDGGTCKPWQGHGTSCASPIVFTETGNFSATFWFVEGSEPLALSCGALDPRPTVTFRWTSSQTKNNSKFRVRGNDTDDLVLEVFSAAPCGPATSLGCNNDRSATELLPEVEMPVEQGKTYFIVVAPMAATPPPGRFALHIDD